jgi:LacI family transcriptional regulator, galactose operon repressor
MRVTLKELARQAGVHPSTISRIVNDDPRLRVSDETRRRVKGLLQKTGYRPDGMARGLKLRHSFVLGVLIPDVLNPLFAAIFRGVEDVALEHGYTVILSSTDGQPDRERDILLALLARRIDGMVVASASLRDPSVRWLRQQSVPHVLVNRYSDLKDPFVGTDDEAGARIATEHLIALGHKRIAHLAGSPRISTAVLRRRGYLAALEAAGIEPDPELIVEAGVIAGGGVNATRRLLALRRPPTAAVAVNDVAAIGAYDAVEQLGRKIPKDLAVTGYNDVPVAARLRPGLTTIHVPAVEFGRESARLLFEQLTTGKVSTRRIVLPPQLVIRGSSDPSKG